MSLIKKIKKFLGNKKARFRYLTQKGIYNNLTDAEYLKKAFNIYMGYELDLENPLTFNEKLQWLKLYDRMLEYTIMADKYKVREYIAEKLGEEYLIPLLGVWESPDDINFETLPKQFVLKCNHNSGKGMYICRDKTKLDIAQVKRNLQSGLDEDYYLTGGREWPYKNIERRVICEQYMNDGESNVLNDYKILCFNGEPKIIEVHKNRFTENHTQNYYDIDWNLIMMSQAREFVGMASDNIEKPKCLEQMIEFSKILAKDICHVRCDWYEIKGRLYFGEITFFQGSGFCAFDDIADDKMLGDYINLSVVHKCNS